MAEFCTPKAQRSRESRIPQTPVNIPPSPFMKKLGFGTGVSVFRWDRSPRTGTVRSPWALKKLNEINPPKTFKQRLELEADILKSLDHPNIVGFRACVPSKDGRIALAMESCEASLNDCIEDRKSINEGPFDSQTILRVALSMARGLDYLHRDKRLLHGDVKSFNVLVNKNFREVKLCDFGVSMQLDCDGEAVNPDAFVGTSVWSAPETRGLFAFPVTSKVDIFAFGLVLWEMIALEIPHVDDLYSSDVDHNISISEEDLENRIGTRPALPPVDLDDSYNAIMEMFYCCTEQDPKLRPSAELLVEWLEDLTGEHPLQSNKTSI